MYMYFSKTTKIIGNHQNFITKVIVGCGETKNISLFIKHLELVNFIFGAIISIFYTYLIYYVKKI
jgi:hypothetical protein